MVSGIHGCLKIGDHTTDEEIKKFIEQEFDKSTFDKDFNNLMGQSYKGLIDFDYKNILKLKNFDEHKNATEIKNIILEILNVKQIKNEKIKISQKQIFLNGEGDNWYLRNKKN